MKLASRHFSQWAAYSLQPVDRQQNLSDIFSVNTNLPVNNSDYLLAIARGAIT